MDREEKTTQPSGEAEAPTQTLALGLFGRKVSHSPEPKPRGKTANRGVDLAA